MIGLGAIDGQSRLDDKGLIDIDKNQIMYFFYTYFQVLFIHKAISSSILLYIITIYLFRKTKKALELHCFPSIFCILYACIYSKKYKRC